MRELIRHILREHGEMVELRKLTTPEFILKAKAKHGDFYDYSESDYKGSKDKVKIICPKHGEFYQEPGAHIFGQGCPDCNREKNRNNTEDFIIKAKEVHGNKYDYSQTQYGTSNKDKIKIICPIHGEFYQKPNNHLTGWGCKKCSGHDRTTTEFIEKSKGIHGDTYDYSRTNYERANKKVSIGCKIHGFFDQKPASHLMGQGCPKCVGKYMDTEEFIRRAKEIFGDKYDYSVSEYKSSSGPILVKCKIHGIFKTSPNLHLSHQSGCPICLESKGERLIRNFLQKNKILFESQHKFTDCNNSVLGRGCKKLPFDFYLPKQKIAIEYDGEQHFFPVERFGGKEKFERQKKYDNIKNQYCERNGIKLLRIPYTMTPEEIETYLTVELGLTN